MPASFFFLGSHEACIPWHIHQADSQWPGLVYCSTTSDMPVLFWCCVWLVCFCPIHLISLFQKIKDHMSSDWVKSKLESLKRKVTLWSVHGKVPLPVADLGFLKGGFGFRWITVIAWIVTSWQASISMQRLQSWCPSVRSVENFRNLGPLRSHLLAFQAPYNEHCSGGRRNCRICSTAPVGLIASFCS